MSMMMMIMITLGLSGIAEFLVLILPVVQIFYSVPNFRIICFYFVC